MTVRRSGFLRGALAAATIAIAGTTAAAAADLSALSAWQGKYPWDKIGGHAFFEVPALRQAIADAVGDGKIVAGMMKLLDSGPAGEIEGFDGRLIAWVCRQHDCDASNWSLIVTPSSGDVLICLFDESRNGGRPAWYRKGQKPVVAGSGCPQDAQDAPAALREAGF